MPVPEELLTAYEHDIQILEKREKSLDDYISALTLRRDALKLKLDEFRRTHPAD
jgi:predicted  nucleic acid-binding Zn-ribbon protein